MGQPLTSDSEKFGKILLYLVKEITFPLNSAEYVIFHSQSQCPDN